MTVEPLLEPAPVSAPPHRGRWLLALVLLIVFVSGGIVGVGSTDYMHRKGWTSVMRRPSEVPDRLVPMLRGKLDLSEAQTGKVDQIVRERHREIEKLRAEVQPRIDRQIEQMQSEIDGVLEPNQRDRWHEWVQSLRHRWGPEHHPRHHGPRPPHGHEAESGWSQRHSARARSKDAADKDSSASGGTDQKPAEQNPATEPAVQEAPAELEKSPLPKDDSVPLENSSQPIAPPAKTDR